MEWVETTGRTTDEAKDMALDQLGVDEADAEFEILEEPRPGLFGRIRGEARVRARVRPTAPRPKTDRRDRRRRKDDAGNPNGDRGSPTSAAAAKDAARTRNGPPAPPEQEITMDDRDDRDEADTGPTSEQVAEDAAEFLRGLLDAFDLEGTVQAAHPSDGEIEVTVEGDGLGLLVGPKGQTLLAVQDLTRLAAQRHVAPGSPRLAVDVGGYRQRRVEALRRFSVQLAEQVAETGLAKSLEPMAAADRKVVHDALNGVEGVRTASEGEEPYRRVVILPAAAD